MTFGFGPDTDPINSFDDLFEVEIGETVFNGYGYWHDVHYIPPHENAGQRRVKRIVGMVDFDLSEFEPVLSVTEPVMDATPEQTALLRRHRQIWHSHHNSYFVLPGYYDAFMQRNMRLAFGHHRADITATMPGHTSDAITSFSYIAHNFSRMMVDNANFFRPGFVRPVPPDARQQVVITSAMLWLLLPAPTQEYYLGRVDELMQLGVPSHIANRAIVRQMVEDDGIIDNMTMDFEIDTYIQGHHLHTTVQDFQVIGIHPYLGNALFWPTQDFYDALAFTVIDSLFIPAATHDQRMDVLNTLTRDGRFTLLDEDGEEVVFNFVVWSGNAREIYFLANMFNLFVGVFRLAALMFALFAILLTYSFIANSINARKKDIGILRSLGASQRDVAGMFIKEGIIIATLKIIMATALCLFMFVMLNNFFIAELGYIAETYTLITFGVRQVLLMTAVTVVGVAISIAWPILRIARKQPVEVIRTGSEG